MWSYKQYATEGILLDGSIVIGFEFPRIVARGYYWVHVDVTVCYCCKTYCKYYERCQSCGKQSCEQCLFYKDEADFNKRDLTCYFCIDENCTGDAYVKEKARRIDSYRVDGDKYKVAEKELNN